MENRTINGETLFTITPQLLLFAAEGTADGPRTAVGPQCADRSSAMITIAAVAKQIEHAYGHDAALLLSDARDVGLAAIARRTPAGLIVPA